MLLTNLGFMPFSCVMMKCFGKMGLKSSRVGWGFFLVFLDKVVQR